jgi:hypothetical protein
VKYANDLVLLAKEERVLHSMTDRLIKVGRFYEIEVNVEKPKVKRISRKASSVHFMVYQSQLKNVDYFSYLGSMITNDARCTREIKSRIAVAKA